MGILPSFNKRDSLRASFDWYEDLHESALLTYFSLVSSTQAYLIFIIRLKVSWVEAFTMFFSSHSSFMVGTYWPVSKQACFPSPPPPLGPRTRWASTLDSYFFLTKEEKFNLMSHQQLFLWHSQKNYSLLRKNSEALHLLCILIYTDVEKFWVLLCVCTLNLPYQCFSLLEVSCHQDYVYPRLSPK